MADTDGDGDVDQLDFAIFQACLTEGGGAISDSPVKCSCYDVAGGDPSGPLADDIKGLDWMSADT